KERGTIQLREQLKAFEAEQASWLSDFAFFMALKQRLQNVSWQDWPDSVRMRDPEALAALAAEIQNDVEFHSFIQFLFRVQWTALKQYANDRGIQIVGDIPIYV